MIIELETSISSKVKDLIYILKIFIIWKEEEG